MNADNPGLNQSDSSKTKFKNSNNKHLTGAIENNGKKRQIIKDVDDLLEEWKALAAEDRVKKLSSLLQDIALLDPKDIKICVDKLAEGKLITKKTAKEEVSKWKDTLGIEDESDDKEKQPSYTANFDGLVDIVDNDGAPAFLVKEDSKLAVYRQIEIEGYIFIPPAKEQIPWLLPRAYAVLDWWKKDAALGNEKADSLLFDDLLSYHTDISELPTEDYYTLIVSWDFHTYLLEPAKYSPIIDFFAVPERGKSRTGKGMINVARRGIHLESLRDAYLVRVANDLQATLFFDVKDVWRKAEKNGTEDILLHRFERGAKVPRVLYPERGAHKDIVYYSIFGPTIIGTNEAIHHILETRAIQINMPETNRKFENDVTPEVALPLKERLVAFRARHLGETLPDILKPASGRLGDILRPLQQIIRLVKPEKEASFLNLVKILEKDRAVEKADSFEAEILKVVVELRYEVTNGSLAVKEITDELNRGRSERLKLTYQRVGRRLSAMGFKKVRSWNGASAVIWDDVRIKNMKIKYGLEEISEISETSETQADLFPFPDDTDQSDVSDVSCSGEMYKNEGNTNGKDEKDTT